MIYYDIIMTDKPDANEITPRVDHRALLFKDILKKPKISLWDLYKLKKHLETGYEKLTEENNEETIEETIEENCVIKPTDEPAIEIQANPDNIGEAVECDGGDDTGSVK